MIIKVVETAILDLLFFSFVSSTLPKLLWSCQKGGGASDSPTSTAASTPSASSSSSSSDPTTNEMDGKTAHYGTKPGQFETLIIHFPTSEGVSDVSERVNE